MCQQLTVTVIGNIEEKFYEPVLNDEETITLLQHTKRHEQYIMEPIIRAHKPNSYIFTKSISEDIVRQNMQDLPLVVVRPSIVMPTLEEPMSYWLRNYNGFLSLVAGSGLGIIQVFHYTKTIKADFTPGDLTANCILAVGWHKATQPASPQIYNCVGSDSNVLVDEMVHETRRYYLASKEAVSKLVWKSHIVHAENTYLLFFLYYILHVIPGLFFSLAELYLNRKPIIMKIYRKFFLFNTMVRYFACNEWLFANDNTTSLLTRLNPRDRELFDFDMGSVSWLKFCSVLYRCVALYIIKDYTPYPKEVYKKKMRFIDPVDKAIVCSFKFLQFYLLLTVARIVYSFLYSNVLCTY
uniref:Fatty acyl-CoA reductase n=1 Tax=Cacopsylla melanoneura TaxID=428564 RepID=A0A8D8PYG1_9HEMI